MTEDVKPDYELPPDGAEVPDEPRSPRADTAPYRSQSQASGGPRPTVDTLTLSLKRSYWTQEPRGSYEVAVAATFQPDHSYSSGQNLDAVHRLLTRRLDLYLGSEEPPTRNGGTH